MEFDHCDVVSSQKKLPEMTLFNLPSSSFLIDTGAETFISSSVLAKVEAQSNLMESGVAHYHRIKLLTICISKKKIAVLKSGERGEVL